MTEAESRRSALARRAGAFFVDLLVVGFLFAIFNFLGPVLAAAYVAFRDGLEIAPFRGRSLGKAALGLRVADSGGESCDARCSLARNWILAVPCLIGVIPILGWIGMPVLGSLVVLVETIFALVSPEGRRFGDELAGTRVVTAARVSS